MKKKVVILVEIALCTMLLISPALASSANSNILDIYGNANEDDTIDMRDLTYVKLIFFGKKPVTELADAKYDGKINPLDFIQIKLIIVGKEKEITLIDQADRIVTVKKPIERVVFISMTGYSVMQILGEVEDKRIVGVSSYIKGHENEFPELSKLPQVGYKDYEAMLSLNPDLVITWGGKYAIEAAEKLPSIPVVGCDLCYSYDAPEGIINLAYILDKEDEAKSFFDDFYDKYIDFVKVRTEGLSEEERQKVYEEAYYKPYTIFPGLVEAAGGIDIFGDLPQWTIVDPEAVIEKNPDIIIKKLRPTDSGYETDDLSKAKAVRDEIMSRPELANVNAVKNRRVYGIAGCLTYGPEYPIVLLYYAKWFYPELFEDLDPQAIHQEYIDRFKRIDFNVYEHGVWVYPPLEE